MTGADLVADAPPPAPRRRIFNFRLPASRGGLAGLAVLLIVATLLAVQFGRQVYLNWEMGQSAAALEREIARMEAENEALQRELAYLRSDAYVSAEARRLANIGLPGEQVLIIPPGAEEPLPEAIAARLAPRPYLEQWIDLFFGPPASE